MSIGSVTTRTPSLPAALSLAARDIKLAHSVFALPFAIFGAVAAWDGSSWRRLVGQGLLVVGCMVGARTWAMLFNRLVDRDVDARNERTRGRAFAAGALGVRTGWALALSSAGVFVLLAGGFWLWFDNPWPLALSLPVLAWIAFYSLTKRFTWMCHVFLGGALGASPLAAGLAVDPGSLTHPLLWLVALFVVLWVAGFDVLYAIQDLEFDRGAGLFSVPSRFGLAGALWIARALHAGALAALVLCWRAEPRLGALFATASGVVALLLAFEHAVVARRGRAGIPMAFFTVNGVVSCVLGAAGVTDILA